MTRIQIRPPWEDSGVRRHANPRYGEIFYENGGLFIEDHYCITVSEIDWSAGSRAFNLRDRHGNLYNTEGIPWVGALDHRRYVLSSPDDRQFIEALIKL